MWITTPSAGTPTATAAEACPFCKSADVKTASKEINVSTYWRCLQCGQIWNSGRLQRPRAPSRRW
jgi:ribosomal protein L37AE/L43A